MNVKNKGFTLIELMIVVSIVAILAVLVYPSFQDTIRKSRRADAMNAILDIHLSQEKYRVNNVSYANLTTLGRGANTIASPDGHYNLSVTASAVSSYTIVATALGDQVNDACGSFTLTFTNGVITKVAGGDDDRCWRR